MPVRKLVNRTGAMRLYSSIRAAVRLGIRHRFSAGDDRGSNNSSLSKMSAGSEVQELRPGRLRVCLAGSGGGHLRQLIDLEPAFSDCDYFFLTEDTALSQSVASRQTTLFVPHFAFGQARLSGPRRMILAALRSFYASARIMLAKRPQVFVSTGAGAVFFGLVWAKLLGAKIVLIESFARFDRPSLFGRMAAGLADRKVAQSPALSAFWPDAPVFDPLKILDTPRPKKKPNLFVTVGAILPFDRMIEMVAEVNGRGEIAETIFIQTGLGGRKPEGLETVESLSFEDIQARLKEADIVICHGGTGSLITALRQGCRLIAVPRLLSQGEVYDDHQAEITKAFQARGLLQVANTADELSQALKIVRGRPPISATSAPDQLIDYLQGLLRAWGQAKA